MPLKLLWPTMTVDHHLHADINRRQPRHNETTRRLPRCVKTTRILLWYVFPVRIHPHHLKVTTRGMFRDLRSPPCLLPRKTRRRALRLILHPPRPPQTRRALRYTSWAGQDAQNRQISLCSAQVFDFGPEILTINLEQARQDTTWRAQSKK